MKTVTVTFVVPDEKANQLVADLNYSLMEQFSYRWAPWVPGAALRDIEAFTVEGPHGD